MQKLIFEKNLQLISDNLPTLKTYKVAVTQILHCLLDNAIRYSKESIQPIVEINAVEHETEWVFSAASVRVATKRSLRSSQ